uniref:Uncharacterized protein n=2 Tax=Ixodes scapularis TaxID=6945 RepID=A0A1S4LY04_IXOSC
VLFQSYYVRLHLLYFLHHNSWCMCLGGGGLFCQSVGGRIILPRGNWIRPADRMLLIPGPHRPPPPPPPEKTEMKVPPESPLYSRRNPPDRRPSPPPRV